MALFVLKRVALLGLMLVGLVLIMFTISHVAPGDPAGVAAGPDATVEMIEVIRREYGLDKPLPVQFWIYLTNVFQGDLGRSIRTSHDVTDDLLRYFPATFELVGVAMLIAVGFGVPLGMLAAVFRDKGLDHGIRFVSVSSVALPMFWLGLLLQLFISLKLGWLPLGGQIDLMTERPAPITHMILVDSLLRGQFETFREALAHVILPAVALSAPALAAIIRVNRAEMIEVLHQDYIVTARAHGISSFRIVAIYALRNAMIPTLAMIGLRFGWMLGGTVLVEGVFDWPGVGLYAVQSAVNSDFQPVMGATLLIGFSFMLANFAIDIAYGWLDPRLREAH